MKNIFGLFLILALLVTLSITAYIGALHIHVNIASYIFGGLLILSALSVFCLFLLEILSIFRGKK